MPAELPGLIRCGGRDLGHPAKTLRYLGMELPSLIEIAELLGASLALYALYLILLIVHEAGHCVAGFLLGLRLISVKVGPVRFERPNAWKWDLRWNAFFKGETRMLLRRLPRRGVWCRYATYILAGPMANLCAGILAVPFSLKVTILSGALTFFIMGSAFMTMANLIPAQSGKSESDGKKLWYLLFSRARRKDLLFRFTLVPRIEEILALLRSRRLQKALEQANELVQDGQGIPTVLADAHMTKRLSDFRDLLQKGREGVQTIASEPREIMPQPTSFRS